MAAVEHRGPPEVANVIPRLRGLQLSALRKTLGGRSSVASQNFSFAPSGTRLTFFRALCVTNPVTFCLTVTRSTGFRPEVCLKLTLPGTNLSG